jgi:hypothetical protein
MVGAQVVVMRHRLHHVVVAIQEVLYNGVDDCAGAANFHQDYKQTR